MVSLRATPSCQPLTGIKIAKATKLSDNKLKSTNISNIYKPSQLVEGIRHTSSQPKSGNYILASEQRYTIAALFAQSYKQKDIAKAMGKDPSVISRELKRNCDRRNGKYSSDLAQKKANKRKANKPKHIRFTEEQKSLVETLLQDFYSPEQICGYVKLNKGSIVSVETIYRYIWQDKQKGGILYTYLRHQGRKYRKRGSAKDSRGILKNQISIDNRPPIVDLKARFGDLEIDTVIGKNHKGALITINDRMTGIVWIRKLKGKKLNLLRRKPLKHLCPLRI